MPNKQQPTTLLIDGDILCYLAACSVESRHDWGDGVVSIIVGEARDAERRFDEEVKRITETIGYEAHIICLSCPTPEGWRQKVLPTYKAHRDPAAKPKLLQHIKDYARRTRRVKEVPTLEADDVMGILSTHPRLIPGRKVIVSTDKDMKTIPGWLFNPSKDSKPRRITPAEADYWHLYQTLVGDAVDGYKGCPGIGPAKAEKVLDESRYGSGMTRWGAVCWAFESKGLTEADALVQARVARICRHTDYDYKRKEVKLWNPSGITQC